MRWKFGANGVGYLCVPGVFQLRQHALRDPAFPVEFEFVYLWVVQQYLTCSKVVANFSGKDSPPHLTDGNALCRAVIVRLESHLHAGASLIKKLHHGLRKKKITSGQFDRYGKEIPGDAGA